MGGMFKTCLASGLGLIGLGLTILALGIFRLPELFGM